MNTANIVAAAAGLTVGYLVFKPKVGAVGAAKQWTVKQWWGNSNDSSKATYKTFPSKKAALAYIKTEERYHKMNNTQFWGASNFYELMDAEPNGSSPIGIFWVKKLFGNYGVMHPQTNKMIEAYSDKKDAELTANGLNSITSESELEQRINSLQSLDGYGYFANGIKKEFQIYKAGITKYGRVTIVSKSDTPFDRASKIRMYQSLGYNVYELDGREIK